MRVKQSLTYQCGYCLKLLFSETSMQTHEKHCKKNPKRVAGRIKSGRPAPDYKRIVPIQCNTYEGLVAKLDEEADKHGITRSRMIEQILSDRLGYKINFR